MPQPSRAQRQQHGWALQLGGSQAFRFYLAQLAEKRNVAHREVCAAASPNREYEAGRLSAFTEAMELNDRIYKSLKPIVEDESSE